MRHRLVLAILGVLMILAGHAQVSGGEGVSGELTGAIARPALAAR